ncbi:hypothetical protein PAB09_02950 [Corynebacterium sp. SCR221107]|uniref:hypothetical protein n=1 Tax=Corynebacterium sp. SCR221107 TaxID=3017361 RepID=UPI0022EC3E2A|nr:hypothetical protein [Corynebacterium sp. SCR221107]WBT09306.1 hypothetical protein PAB09_02950 [Corynebacterium sp. SCR221107]
MNQQMNVDPELAQRLAAELVNEAHTLSPPTLVEGAESPGIGAAIAAINSCLESFYRRATHQSERAQEHARQVRATLDDIEGLEKDSARLFEELLK